MTSAQITPGIEVHARGLLWQVVNVTDQAGSRHCRLRGLGGALLGEEIEIVLGVETVVPIRKTIDPRRAGRIREWLPYHQAFLLEQALGPGALLAAQPGRLRIEPYQLVPVVRALALNRVRLLLADGVGLGKTIQAGLIVAELIARRLAHRILVVSPAGPLLEQWRAEFRDRFGLRLSVIDRSKLDEVRRAAELGANPFDHISMGLASVDFLKQDRVLAELERTAYDVIIIDEAHHSVEAGTGATKDDSQRRRLALALARRCDSLLLLTATPHDGNDRSFASLCELLDPSLVDGRGTLREGRYRKHLVRRLKRHVLNRKTGEPLFPDREVTPHPVVVNERENPAFAKLTRSLLAFIAPEFKRAIRAKEFGDVLSFFALLKRSVSTVAACRTTLEAVRKRLTEALNGAVEEQQARKERIRSQRELRRRLERFGATSAEEEAELAELELEDVVQRLADLERESRREGRSSAQVESKVTALNELVKLADGALDADPKLNALVEQVQEVRAKEPSANILIYTEYTTSQGVAEAALKNAGFNVLTLSGEDKDKDRLEKTDRFRSEDDLVMVCTDAAAEGLNLHQRCHHLIHLELPFNPNRLEQRNGRIDRYGQQHTPMVRYLYLAGTFEGNILLRLIAKYERQRKVLTSMPNTLGVTASDDLTAGRLLQGVIESEGTLFKSTDQADSFETADPATGADEHTKELLAEIDR
ncbi:MAG: DEAD/DEAH box helicase, partial [Planctomycetes bacterium]|nr:DEAD/DEAH box helicase [Planctomycetota bacterium]